ncbi:glycosyltransferase [Macrococcus armenti]|uniref:glycosyltransferase n=1 Tax=Macrococcus armenti TaxID=2875764 RepID=UPI001CCF844C|nr:glycosyltransferase [Macrococcus armenti]UBH13852.1 glycosyltransferase [Macrococcus armenti]UBH23079.1 glycosyltransferase [Macrococcus armenti]
MIYSITSVLAKIHGGRTKSLLERIKLMDEQLKTNTTLLTTNYNIEYPEIYRHFKEQEIVPQSVQFENMYEWLSNYNISKPKKSFFKKESFNTGYNAKNFKEEKVSDCIYRYYEQGKYKLYKKFYSENKIHFEDFMSDYSNKKVKRNMYDKFGNLHLSINYHPKTNKKISDSFYDINGFNYLNRFFDEKNKIISIEYNKPDGTFEYFSNEKQLFQYYFEHKFNDGDIIFNDARLLDRPLLMSNKKTKNVLVLHSSHKDVETNETLPSYKFALDHHDKVFKYIVLTGKQKQDILAVSDVKEDKLQVIPHFIGKKEHNRAHIRNQFVYIGRYSPEKQLDKLLYAFKDFKNMNNNDIKLVMYGKDDKNNLKDIKFLVKELGLDESVEINDFTNDAHKIFSESIAALMTSKFEGFGLTLMESINVGCPVVSFDVDYGPSEIIQNHVNGILVNPGDIHGFSKALEEILDNKYRNVEINEKLSIENAIINYKKLIESLTS